MFHVYMRKNYTSPDLSRRAPAPIGWPLQPQPQRMNGIEIAGGTLHVQYRGTAVLHSVILYQNGHSGTEPPQIVSTDTIPNIFAFARKSHRARMLSVQFGNTGNNFSVFVIYIEYI